MQPITHYIEFSDKKLKQRCLDGKIPMETFYEAYFSGDLDFKTDVCDFLSARNDFVRFSFTPSHLKWAVTHFIPEVAIHSKSQDQRIVREHYDRGNDFFGWFLGERMVYTAAFFQTGKETLEQAQDNKLNLVCQKLQLQPQDTLLDIGCGWGTLARHAAVHYGADATGVTLSKNQTLYGNQRIEADGVADHARILCLDYRDIPKKKYSKIVSLEMVEHVGNKNLRSFYEQTYELLADDGLFLLQWAGLRQALKPEDLIWGLFMNRHIFPGADASLCGFAMLKHMEKVNFEIHSVENVTIHYSMTIKKWHENWISNREAVTAAYGDRWYRIWNFFLGWSTIVAQQGNASCFQVVLNKNLDHFLRTRWIGHTFSLGEHAKNFSPRNKTSEKSPSPSKPSELTL